MPPTRPRSVRDRSTRPYVEPNNALTLAREEHHGRAEYGDRAGELLHYAMGSTAASAKLGKGIRGVTQGAQANLSVQIHPRVTQPA